ncbi:MAG: hypothetical protein ABI563_08650 [Specibacter sp.]
MIRETAHAAVGELREVLGVVHEDGARTTQQWQPVGTGPAGGTGAGEPDAAMSRTAPSGIDQIAGLVTEWSPAGLIVDYTPNPAQASGIPDAPSRAAYRVVQEGITNVVRHAPRLPQL